MLLLHLRVSNALNTRWKEYYKISFLFIHWTATRARDAIVWRCRIESHLQADVLTRYVELSVLRRRILHDGSAPAGHRQRVQPAVCLQRARRNHCSWKRFKLCVHWIPSNYRVEIQIGLRVLDRQYRSRFNAKAKFRHADPHPVDAHVKALSNQCRSSGSVDQGRVRLNTSLLVSRVHCAVFACS